jgi:hypothetical protein
LPPEEESELPLLLLIVIAVVLWLGMTALTVWAVYKYW